LASEVEKADVVNEASKKFVPLAGHASPEASARAEVEPFGRLVPGPSHLTHTAHRDLAMLITIVVMLFCFLLALNLIVP
jgi:hypothetical protein